MKMRKIFIPIAGFIILLLFQFCKNADEAMQKQMIKSANDMNKTFPAMVDRETRIDNVVVLPDKVFQYNFTFINLLKDSVDFVSMAQEMQPTVLNGVKSSPDLKTFRDHKVTFAYQYSDKNGMFMFKILITPEKYK
jgi:hypothetical protein